MQPTFPPGHPLAMLSLVLTLGMGIQSDKVQAQSSAATDSQQLRFDVPVGSLDQVLLDISRQAGQLISFQQTLVQGRSGPAIQGALSVEQAIEQALQGNGLQAQRGESGWSVQAASVAETISVQAPSDADTQLQPIMITGSRIARAQVEGPSPVTVISARDIEARGYRNVYEALATQTQNTGMTQGEDFGNTWQPAASALNLRGLGPNHTLVLINGRRVADYPTAYGGRVNFTNLANIPSAAIERIEILSSGASAVYGSDAIAGVVNIILKEKASGVDVNVRAGTTERGGGDNQRLQITGGDSWGDFDGLFSLEITHRDPIWGNQRGFMDSYEPGHSVGYRRDLNSGRYLGPGCSAYSGLFGGGLQERDGRCFTDQYFNNYWTLQTQKENYNGYTRGAWNFSDTGQAFADLMFGFNHIQNNTRGPSFTSPNFINQSTGQLERWFRQFGPEEIGGRTSGNGKWKDVSWTASVGLEDSIGDSGWDYQIAANR